jgi:hypothetical protein
MKGPCGFGLALLLALAVSVASQDQQQDFHPRVPTITFDRIWEAGTPQEVTISVKADGPSTYLSRDPLKPVAAGEEKNPDYTVQFTMSPANQRKIFRFAGQADYFNGNFDYTAHRVASTGKKTLTYADATRHFQTVYDWSENKPIQELTDIFSGISNTIEHGRKLDFLYKYDKLGLEAELKAMEEMAAGKQLDEIQVIAPTLKRIADDSAIMNIARERAKRLLAKASR